MADTHGRCLYCGTEFAPGVGGSEKQFCSGAHRTKYWQQTRRRGGAIVPLLTAWHKERDSSRKIARMEEIVFHVRQWIAEDAEIAAASEE